MKNSLSNDKESVVNAFSRVQPVSETGCTLAKWVTV